MIRQIFFFLDIKISSHFDGLRMKYKIADFAPN